MSDLVITNIDMVIAPFLSGQFDENSPLSKDLRKVKHKVQELKKAMDEAYAFVENHSNRQLHVAWPSKKHLDVIWLSDCLQVQKNSLCRAFYWLRAHVNFIQDCKSTNIATLKDFGIKDEAAFSVLSEKVNNAYLNSSQYQGIHQELTSIREKIKP